MILGAAVAFAAATWMWWGSGGGLRSQAVLRRPVEDDVGAVDIADVADLLALALTSGRGVTEAMETVAAVVGGRLGRDLSVVVAAGRWGVDEAATWDLVDPAWRPVARALVLAEAAGVPPATTLVSAADDIRRREAHRLAAAVERLSVHLVLPLGLTYLPAFILTTVLPLVGALGRDLLLP